MNVYIFLSESLRKHAALTWSTETTVPMTAKYLGWKLEYKNNHFVARMSALYQGVEFKSLEPFVKEVSLQKTFQKKSAKALVNGAKYLENGCTALVTHRDNDVLLEIRGSTLVVVRELYEAILTGERVPDSVLDPSLPAQWQRAPEKLKTAELEIEALHQEVFELKCKLRREGRRLTAAHSLYAWAVGENFAIDHSSWLVRWFRQSTKVALQAKIELIDDAEQRADQDYIERMSGAKLSLDLAH